MSSSSFIENETGKAKTKEKLKASIPLAIDTVEVSGSPHPREHDNKPQKISLEQAIECRNLVQKLNHEKKERERKR